MRRKRVFFNREELVTLIVLTAKHDPARFGSKKIQALILKCQAEVEDPSELISIE